MPIGFEICRTALINVVHAGPDDVLILSTDRDASIFLRLVKDRCNRRWEYMRDTMPPADAAQIDEIIENALSQEGRATAVIVVYTPFGIKPDRPLDCEVRATWPDLADMGERLLGTFESDAGCVIDGVGHTLTPTALT